MRQIATISGRFCTIDDKQFDSEEAVCEHLEKTYEINSNHELYYEVYCDVDEEELSGIEEAPEEFPLDESSIEEKELEEEAEELETILNNLEIYEHLGRDEKGEIWEEALPTHKEYPPDVKTSNLIEWLYAHAIEKLSDKDSWICPYRHRDLRALSRVTGEELASDSRYAKLKHLKEEHSFLWKVMEGLFIKPVSLPRIEAFFTSNPESCSEFEELTLGGFTKEELSELDKKADRGELTKEERERILRALMRNRRSK